MVDHENTAKQNYEYFTGDVTAQKFYQGRLKNEVDDKVQTWKSTQPMFTQFRHGYKPRSRSGAARKTS